MLAGIISISLFIIGLYLMYKNPHGHIPKDVALRIKKLRGAQR